MNDDIMNNTRVFTKEIDPQSILFGKSNWEELCDFMGWIGSKDQETRDKVKRVKVIVMIEPEGDEE